jgi:hypothetical protein
LSEYTYAFLARDATRVAPDGRKHAAWQLESRAHGRGLGVDRTAGAYRVSGTVMINQPPDRREVTLVSSVDRSFARATRTIRVFAVYNPRRAAHSHV